MKRFLSVLVMAAAALSLFAGCSAGDSAAYPGSAGSAAEGGSYDNYDAYPAEASYEPHASNADYEEDFSAVPTFLAPENATGIRLVYTVDMTLQTTAFPEGTRRLLGTVEEVGGFVRSTHVEGRSLYEPDAPRYARYTLSIPTVHLAKFLTEMEDLFNLVRLSQDSRDLTVRYAGSNSRLDTLRQQEQELSVLLAALNPSEDLDEMLELEEMLDDIRREIALLGASVSGMDVDILYSTVTIQLYEVVGLDEYLSDGELEPFGDRLRDTADGSVNAFVRFWQGALLFLTAAWPVLAVLGVLAVLVLLVWRLLRRAGLPRRLSGPPADNTAPDGSGPSDEV